MTDMEIARVLRIGRRQGFDQACGVAFFAFLAMTPVLFFTNDAAGALAATATGVLAVMGFAGVVTNRDLDA